MRALYAALLLSTAFSASAINAYNYSSLEGYTVIKVTKVDGYFKGCEHRKQIKLQNGWILACNTYHYYYAYSPDAVIFARSSISAQAVKMLVADHIYDMQLVKK